MAELKQIDGALTQIRQAAQKASQEEIKKIAQKMVEHNKGKRLAAAKLQATITEHDVAIAKLEEDAAQVVADFEADWGPWDTKPQIVVT